MATREQNTASKDSNNTAGSDILFTLPNNITVRNYRQSDVQSLSRHGNNRRIWDNLRNRMPHPYTEENAKEWIDRCNEPAHCVRSGPWTPETGSQGPLIPTNFAIVIDDEAVGSIGLEFNDSEDVHARVAEVGYWLGEAHWGKGVMSAVLPAFVEWTWKTFEILVRLHATANDRNAASRRCLAKAGFQFEGVMKCHYFKNGVVGDTVMQGMVRPGFQSS